MRTKNNTETSLWISNTDLISGMLVIFLFLAVALIQQSEAIRSDIINITDESNRAVQQLRDNIKHNFTEAEIKHYHLDSDEAGYAYFNDGDTKFPQGSAVIPENFKNDLRVFLPKYLMAISQCDEKSIKEIRIEGHTSSEWAEGMDPNASYFYNMKLSQERTRAIIEYAFTLPELVPYHGIMKTKLTANGLSSSHLIKNHDGTENDTASRRIEFRIVANDKLTIDKIRDAVNRKI